LRTSRHKYIAAPRPELYDLEQDPGEGENVIQRNRRLYADLEGRLDAMVESVSRDAGSEASAPPLDEETLAQLEALGYLAGRGGVSLADEDARERADPKDRIDLHQQVMLAQSDLGRGELDAARGRLEAAVAEDPSMVDGHQMLGTIAMRQERAEEAVDHFRRALEVKPDHAAALFGLASVYRRQGLLDEAQLGFEQLLRLDSTDVKAVAGLAELLQLRGQRAEAIELLQEAVAVAGPPAVLLNQLGELRALEGDRPAALSLFERAVEARPDFVLARFNLAVLLEETGRLDAAIELYEDVIERAPRHFQAQFNLGKLHGARGSTGRQRELWEAAIESNPDFTRGYFLLAKLMMDAGGDLQRAEELVRDGLARDDEHRAGPLGYYVLADLLNRTGRRREAAQALAEGRRIEGRGSAG
jgi:tetratricopeptide (TPR) repeat protein